MRPVLTRPITARPSWYSKYLPLAGSGCRLWIPGQDDPLSSAWRDRSGYGHDGNIVGAVYYRLGRGLQVLSFDASDDYVSFTNAATLDPTTGLTVEACVYANTWVGDSGIFDKRISSDGYYLQYQSATSKLGFNVRVGGSSKWARTDSTPATGTMLYVVGTWDAANGVKLYINAVLQTENPALASRSASAGYLYIGRATFSNKTHDGYIGLPLITDYAFTADYIKYRYRIIRTLLDT